MQTTNLDHQAVKAAMRYMGNIAWPTILLALTVIGGFIAVPLWVVMDLLPLWAGVLLQALVTYAAYTVMHDAVHGAIAGKAIWLRGLQNVLGYCMGFILMIPFSAHRYEHNAHHRHTNDPEKDPDFQVADMGRSPFHALRSAYRLLSGQFRYYRQHRWAAAKVSERAALFAEIVIAVGARGLLVAQGFWAEALLLYVVGTLLGLVLLIYLFAYIVHRPHTDEGRYVDTSTITLSGSGNTLLTWFWLFQNYHSIHHLFPKVPFYKYKALFDDIEPIMRAQGSPIYRLSWMGLKPKQAYSKVKIV
jgi:fatty acid desaturase